MKTPTLKVLIAVLLIALFYQLTVIKAVAQTPQKINYQAIVRDTSGNIMKNQSVSFLMTIREGSPGGSDIYHETHDITTNTHGLAILKIGNGTYPNGSFTSINWGSGDKYLEIQLDANGPAGGYTWTYFGTTQLLSVPYALYAGKTSALDITGSSGQTLRHDGTSWIANSNLFNDGANVGIGTSAPTALLHTSGTDTSGGNVLFVGAYKSTGQGVAPASGGGTRMMWYPDKAAFRAGIINDSRWDTDSIGDYSMATGYNTKAKGIGATALGLYTNASGWYSTAMGDQTKASGINSTAMGNMTNASGFSSTALGHSTIASGIYSTAMGQSSVAAGQSSTAMGRSIANGNYATAMGQNSLATGDYSTAMGSGTTASGVGSTAIGEMTNALSYDEIAIGSYNTTYSPLGTTYWNDNDRLFVIGNGDSPLTRRDALTILKNGNTGIGISQPTVKLDVFGTVKAIAFSGDGTQVTNVTAQTIVDGAITAQKIANGAVTQTKIATDAVNSSAIVNGSVGYADINTNEVQRRVNASCPAGSSIRVINADGTVVCETDDNTIYSAGNGLTLNAGAYHLIAPVSVINGGTGFTSYTVGDLLYASGSSALSKLPDVSTGNVLLSGGSGAAPAWGKVTLAGHVSGILPVINGGTGQSTSLNTGGVIYAQTPSTMASTMVGNTGQILSSNGSGAPVWIDYNGLIQTQSASSSQLLTLSWQNFPGGSVMITAPYAGTIEVQANVRVTLDHTMGVSDILYLGIDVTTSAGGPTNDMVEYDIPGSMPSFSNCNQTFTVTRRFVVTAGTYVYYLNGMMSSGASSDRFSLCSMRAVFY